MRAYGRWQGYAWSVVVVASGTAYALSLGLRRESGRRANDVDDDGGGGGGRRFDSIRFDSQLCLSRQRGFRYNARAV